MVNRLTLVFPFLVQLHDKIVMMEGIGDRQKSMIAERMGVRMIYRREIWWSVLIASLSHGSWWTGVWWMAQTNFFSWWTSVASSWTSSATHKHTSHFMTKWSHLFTCTHIISHDSHSLLTCFIPCTIHHCTVFTYKQKMNRTHVPIGQLAYEHTR